IETVIIHQWQLIGRHFAPIFHPTDRYWWIVFTCSAVVVWASLYVITVTYLIGRRRSVAASVSHSALVGSYLVASLACGADQLIPLTTVDQFLTLLQLALGLVFVTLTRRRNRAQ